jgi:hypothetical protein
MCMYCGLKHVCPVTDDAQGASKQTRFAICKCYVCSPCHAAQIPDFFLRRIKQKRKHCAVLVGFLREFRQRSQAIQVHSVMWMHKWAICIHVSSTRSMHQEI